jgi:hypothetical protein
MTYEWRNWTDEFKRPWTALVPVDEPNNYSLRRIASVCYDGQRQWVAAYHYPHSTGNKRGQGALLKSKRSALKWIENNLAKFWEPPVIR